MTFCAFLRAQQPIPPDSVPKQVLKRFNQQFPRAFDIDWKISGNLFRVGFQDENRKNEAAINDKGQVVILEQQLNASELPVNLSKGLSRDFVVYNLETAVRSVRQGEITYVVKIKAKEEEWNVVYDNNGNQKYKYQN